MISFAPEQSLVCSAKGCRAASVHAVVWRNPALHAPDRRKVWLACPEHRDHLGDFLRVRGFLLEIIPVESLTEADG